MRLSKEEREVLRRLYTNKGYKEEILCNHVSYIYDSPYFEPILKLYSKGILGVTTLSKNKVMVWIADCGLTLLREHPELLHRNAFSALLSRLRVFVKEHFITALCALICVFLVLLIIILTHGQHNI